MALSLQLKPCYWAVSASQILLLFISHTKGGTEGGEIWSLAGVSPRLAATSLKLLEEYRLYLFTLALARRPYAIISAKHPCKCRDIVQLICNLY